MEPRYSVWADWLSKFHTWPEAVQALRVVGLTLTALGMIAGAAFVLATFAEIFKGYKAEPLERDVLLRGTEERLLPDLSGHRALLLPDASPTRDGDRRPRLVEP